MSQKHQQNHPHGSDIAAQFGSHIFPQNHTEPGFQGILPTIEAHGEVVRQYESCAQVSREELVAMLGAFGHEDAAAML